MNGLGETGLAVWQAFAADKLDGATQALVRELARTGDTLDSLDKLVKSKDDVWARVFFDEAGEVTLVVDKLLDERAKQQVTFKTLWAELRQSGVKPQLAAKPTADEVQQDDVLGAFRRAKEERERQSG